ncbi:MAG: hypothetical protein PGN29_08090 [Gordonia paraffinivorans]
MAATTMRPTASLIGLGRDLRSGLASAGRVDIDDPVTGARVAVATPAGDVALWRRYLDGARAVYHAHGVGAALDHDAVVDGGDTTVFFAIVDDDDVCRGGLRVQGPYGRVDETHALHEWAGSPGRDDLVRAIGCRLDDGIVETKTAWVDPAVDDSAAAADLLARMALPILVVTGARHLMATSADHSLRRWTSSGGRIDESVRATHYPDERYRTRLMWWDRDTLDRTAGPGVVATMRREVELLAERVDRAAVAA